MATGEERLRPPSPRAVGRSEPKPERREKQALPPRIRTRRRRGTPYRARNRQESIVGSDTSRTSVFRAFERAEFLESSSWTRLQAILDSNGGSFGISGPRGAGKSWLMLRAIDDARLPGKDRRPGGIGLWYPSPSEYDPLAFLASLSEGLANEIERRFRREHPLRDAIGGNRLLWLGLSGVVGLAVCIGLAFAFTHTRSGAALVAALTALTVGLGLLVAWLRARRPEERLLREAAIVRERARYSTTRREALELAAEGGRGVAARVRTSRERELTERPATLSSLVNDLRALAAEAGEVAGRVVIAIDELDKMSEPEKVRALLRDIKGIFEVPRVHFLVSVSDEAASSLTLGALTGRNEFNSSFYTVIEVPPAPPERCAELLALRTGTRTDVGITLGILSGGNPREVLRIAEFAGAADTPAEAAVRALREEALDLRRDIVTAQNATGSPDLGEEPRLQSFTHLPDDDFESIQRFSTLAQRTLDDEMWMPPWKDEGWEVRFGEPWRRLMVRLAVARELITNDDLLVVDPAFGLQLQDVVTAASQSASVARIVLEQGLRVDARALKRAAVSE